MANTFKNYPLALDGTLQTVYTVAASTTAIVIGMRVSNKDGVNSATCDLYADIGGTDFNYLGQDTPIPAGSSLNALAGEKLVLETGDKIEAQASVTGDLDIILSVLEIT